MLIKVRLFLVIKYCELNAKVKKKIINNYVSGEFKINCNALILKIILKT